MKIAILGGTGQVGTVLARSFHRDGHEVIVFGRHASERTVPWQVARWSFADGPWSEKLDGADVVINLAGRSVNCRYTAANRKEIIVSREESVRAVERAIARAKNLPALWLQASTATIYAHTYGPANDEFTGTIGGNEPKAPDTWRFSIEVATRWEKALEEAQVRGTRKVAMRAAMIMSPDHGGVFDTLLRLVRFGLGGTSGDGRQFVSWVHERDFVRAVYFLSEHKELDGAVNISSPNPLPNREFMVELRRAWGAKIGLPASRWMLEMGAFLLRSETELILKSRRVVSGRLTQAGFQFDFPTWPLAAKELCERWKQMN